MTPARLRLNDITKRYPAVLANDQISFEIQPGEIHALLGENGAGKSTLMKIIYGAARADSGTVHLDGQALSRDLTPQMARSLGISMVFQHFSLFDTLTVAQNVWLGLDKTLSLRDVTARILDKASAYGLDVDPERLVHTLSVGEMQRVEIIRALLTEPKLLILDEPTSVLSPQAVERLFVVLRQIAAQGCAIVYISHKLHEIRALCSYCTVMRAGRVVATCEPAKESNASLGRLMMGTDTPALQRQEQAAGEPRLMVANLSAPRSDPFGVDLQAINLQVCAGEVVGIAGVSGNGQRELLAVLNRHDKARVNGLHYVPEERLGTGAIPSMSLSDNMLLTRSQGSRRRFGIRWLQSTWLTTTASAIIGRFGVKAAGWHALAQSLSGGNLQKFIVGREIDAKPQVLVLAQPTWGVDVGASAKIRSEILTLRDSGCAVLVVSDDLDELFELADRLHVMAAGRLSPSVATSKATPTLIGQWMSGLWSDAA